MWWALVAAVGFIVLIFFVLMIRLIFDPPQPGETFYDALEDFSSHGETNF